MFYEEVTLNRFEQAMREAYKGAYSLEGLYFMFSYYDDIADSHIDVELDVYAIACDWAEYSTLRELVNDIGCEKDLEFEKGSYDGFGDYEYCELENGSTIYKLRNTFLRQD